MFGPAIAAMGGNSGLQTSTTVVLGLATGDLAALNLKYVFIRGIKIALIIAFVCGFLAALASTTILYMEHEIRVDSSANLIEPTQAPVIGFAVGLSMLCGILVATSLGLILPFLFRRLGIDPAISSGPLVTTGNDIVSYVTYFSIALLLLHLWKV